eukprot:4849653-Prymnesium_polylepis.1
MHAPPHCGVSPLCSNLERASRTRLERRRLTTRPPASSRAHRTPSTKRALSTRPDEARSSVEQPRHGAQNSSAASSAGPNTLRFGGGPAAQRFVSSFRRQSCCVAGARSLQLRR